MFTGRRGQLVRGELGANAIKLITPLGERAVGLAGRREAHALARRGQVAVAVPVDVEEVAVGHQPARVSAPGPKTRRQYRGCLLT